MDATLFQISSHFRGCATLDFTEEVEEKVDVSQRGTSRRPISELRFLLARVQDNYHARAIGSKIKILFIWYTDAAFVRPHPRFRSNERIALRTVFRNHQIGIGLRDLPEELAAIS